MKGHSQPPSDTPAHKRKTYRKKRENSTQREIHVCPWSSLAAGVGDGELSTDGLTEGSLATAKSGGGRALFNAGNPERAAAH